MSNRHVITQLNAKELAAKIELLSSNLEGNVADWVNEDLLDIARHIREVAQPVVDERDALRTELSCIRSLAQDLANTLHHFYYDGRTDTDAIARFYAHGGKAPLDVLSKAKNDFGITPIQKK